MKKNLFKIATFIAVSILIACAGGEGPKNVAEKFLKETQAENFDGAKKYCTEETGKLLDMMASFAKMGDKDKKEKKDEKKFTMVDEKIDGDNATVTYKIEGKETGEQSLKMKKVNGKWLVSVSKDDMSKKDGGMPKDKDHDKDAPAENSAAPNDSTKK